MVIVDISEYGIFLRIPNANEYQNGRQLKWSGMEKICGIQN